MSVETSLELNRIQEQVASFCASDLGKKQIQAMKPSFEKLIVKRDNARMKEAFALTSHYGPMPFAGIKDLEEGFKQANKGRVLTSHELLDVIHFIQGIQGMQDYIKQCSDIPHPEIKDLSDTLVVHTTVKKYLSDCINEYGEVKDSASTRLKEVRRSLKQMDGQIAEASNHFVSEHANSVVDSIVTTRYGRAVVLVKATEKNRFGGMVYGDSASGQASYVEPQVLMNLNNKKMHLIEEEKEEVETILRNCSNEVKSIAKEEIANLETCAILDSIFAKAEWGKSKDACVADLSEGKNLDIVKARHPLIDPKSVVCNDYHLEPPHRMLLITGPNTGGKTVSMKIIGLFTLMTYCGMPIPAESAIIPYFDHVFADIGDDQSVESSLSSFSSHIEKQAEIMRYATDRSLVLLDEAGSGTDPREGEALAISLLNALREKKCLTVATTHYGRLKTYGKRHEDILLASVQFDMEKLMPTYKYMEGFTGSSNAFEVAEKYGLPDSIIKYARFLKNQAKTEEEELIERLERQLNENARRGELLEKQIQENEEKAKQLAKQELQIQHEKNMAHDKAEKEAKEYLEKVKQEADAVLSDIRDREKQVHYHEALSKKKDFDTIIQENEQQDRIPSNHVYQVGDAVELRSSDQVCEIVKIEKKDITILLNGRELRVKQSQIRPSLHVIPKMKKKPEESVHVSTGVSLFSSMSMECNLIGMHVDEAMEIMDRYVDQAKLHHLTSFRIIHGDGSGALRKAVHERLLKDKSVKEYRLGMPSEGGTGATVVTLY